VAGALLTAAIAGVYERFGAPVVVAVGAVAMAAGIASLGLVGRPWQLYPVFLVMSVRWGAMSGGALNILGAPWFQRRRGLAVSLAFNGATLGGVLVAPVLLELVGRLGFARALGIAALAQLAVLLALAAAVLRRGPETLGMGPDGDAPRAATPRGTAVADRGWRGDALRTWRFWSVSAPLALGLAAQGGGLAPPVALVTPPLRAGGAARVVSATTAAALIGRLATGFVVDRLNRRVVTSVTLLVQLAGLALLARSPSAAGVYAACALFGLGVGNLTTLPGLILAVEWPREHFSGLVGLVVGINQLTFAFGPTLVGIVRDWAGAYPAALGACAVLQ